MKRTPLTEKVVVFKSTKDPQAIKVAHHQDGGWVIRSFLWRQQREEYQAGSVTWPSHKDEKFVGQEYGETQFAMLSIDSLNRRGSSPEFLGAFKIGNHYSIHSLWTQELFRQIATQRTYRYAMNYARGMAGEDYEVLNMTGLGCSETSFSESRRVGVA